jgi:hypothetical protein
MPHNSFYFFFKNLLFTMFTPNRTSRVQGGIALTVAMYLLAFLPTASAQTIFALSQNQLISFEAASPTAVLSATAITGIAAGQSIEGLDFRPATGQLYAFGYNQTTGEARLYTIDRATGAASAIGAAAISLQANMGMTLSDLTGRQVATVLTERRTAGPQNARLEVADLVPGCYFVQVFANGVLQQTQKLMVQ